MSPKTAIIAFLLLISLGSASAIPGDVAMLTEKSGSSPSFSPSGGKIVYSSMASGASDIWVMNADGTGAAQLTDDIYLDETPVWGAGGRIAFVSERGGNYDIYAMDQDGGNQIRLTSGRESDLAPSFSPGGDKIAYMSGAYPDYDIYVMNADGSEKKRLTTGASGDWTPVWSPGGDKIAYMSASDGKYEIRVMNADGTGDELLLADSYWKGQLAWGQNGKIAFVSLEEGNYDIYVMNTDGTDVQKLTENRFWQTTPSWSQNGNMMAYTSDETGMQQIWVMDLEMPEQKPLIEAAPRAAPVPAIAASAAVESTAKEETRTTNLQEQDDILRQNTRTEDYLNGGMVITLLAAFAALSKRATIKRRRPATRPVFNL